MWSETKGKTVYKGSSISSGTHYQSWEWNLCFFHFEKSLKKACFLRFHHTPDVFANVTSQKLHSTAGFHVLCLKKAWKTQYLRHISFLKKYFKINKTQCCFWLFSWIFWIVKINYFFNISPIYEHFKTWFVNEFFITFDQKRLIFSPKLTLSRTFYDW